MNILGDSPPFAKQNATDFLQVDQQHLQLMDTFLQLFYLLWTWTADMKWIQWYVDICADGLYLVYDFVCKICRNKIGSGYVRYIIGVRGGCPETSGKRSL